MGPIEYNAGDPGAAILQGLKIGSFQNAIETERQQQALALQAAQQQQADLRALSMNPNAGASDYASMMTRYPGLSKQLGEAFKMVDEGQKQNLLNFQSRVYAAQQSGNTELAVQMLRDRAKADPRDAQHYSTMADLIEKSPATARTITGLSLAAAMGPDKFAEAFSKIGGEQRAQEQAGADLRKKEADATAAEADAVVKGEQAKVAPQTVLLDLQKKGWDIEKIKADIVNQREDNRIKAMQAAISREGNDLKREELRLKVEEARTKQADGIREKVATVESARATMDNLLNTADRFLEKAWDPQRNEPRLTLNRATGPVASKLPTVSGETADLEALLETLGSQAFLAQVPNMKGMGQLTEREGAKLEAALANLKLTQSPEQLVGNVKEAQRLIQKARKNLVTRYGVPDTVPDTPAAAKAAGPNTVDALVEKYTRGGK